MRIVDILQGRIEHLETGLREAHVMLETVHIDSEFYLCQFCSQPPGKCKPECEYDSWLKTYIEDGGLE